MANSNTKQKSEGTSLPAVLAMSMVPILMVLGNSMLIPEFPKIQKALHITQFQVGLLITLFSATAGITIPILGFLSDRYGRKVIIIPSLLIYGLGGLISGLGATIFGPSFTIVLIGRVIQGLGAAGTAPIVMAMAGDLFKGSDRSQVMGTIEAANGIGKVLSPILGTLVALITWWALFFSYSILSIPIALAVFFLTKEPEGQKEKQPLGQYFQSILQVFKDKGLSLVVSLFAGAIVLMNLFGVLSIISDILEKRNHLQGITKGLIIAIPIFVMSVLAFITGIVLKKKNKFFKVSILAGLSVAGAALILLPFFKNAFIYIGILSVMGLGTGLVLPAVNTLVTSSTQSQQRGGVTSIYGSARFIGVAVGPPLFSLLYKVSPQVMFWTAAALSLIVGGLVLAFLKEGKLLPDGKGQGKSANQEKNQAHTAHWDEEKSGVFKRKNKV